MHHLLLAALIIAFGMAISLATAKGLQHWAIVNFESHAVGLDGYIAERPSWLLTYVTR